MGLDKFNPAFRVPVRAACYLVSGLGILYAITTTIGLLTLPGPQFPISDPYFTLMEVLSILVALVMAISVVAVHQSVTGVGRFFSLAAALLMCLTLGVTSCVHITVLSLRLHLEPAQLSQYGYFLSFRWPSVVYALDILAWDFFYGLSVLFLARVFGKDRYERRVRTLLLVSGILSLAGLTGVPAGDMQIRNIGILGYAGVGPLAFFFMGRLFGCSEKE